MKILLFSSESFLVLYFTLWSMIHFRFVLYKMEGLKWLRAFCVLHTKNFPASFVCQDYPFSISCFCIFVKPVSPVHMGLLCPLCSVPLSICWNTLSTFANTVSCVDYYCFMWNLVLVILVLLSFHKFYQSTKKKKKILLQLLSGLH